MDQTAKAQSLIAANAHIAAVTAELDTVVGRLDRALASATEAYQAIDAAESETALEDRLRSLATRGNTLALREQMAQLASSPYFARLDLAFADEPLRPYYIAKHSASELGIYSWTSAVAALRFEAPGQVSYETPERGQRSGHLNRRDQYMIARGHLNFMTTEAAGRERELVYQEHFSGRKGGFVLPEVVAQMEKAQDQVVRADHRGPFVISGPAGSGKTTLALHRVAFLRQSPETTRLYPAAAILVLVQDAGTEDYFSHLLPELGIHDVQITTFGRWALTQLGLKRMSYVARPGHHELERDQYEFAKLQALGAPLAPATLRELKTPHRLLAAHYREHLDDTQLALFADQAQDGSLDRFDLTLLLRAQERAEGRLMVDAEQTTYLRGGHTRTKLERVPREYSLILVDEFQNYLPEQLRLLQGVTDSKNSMVYIGDLAQQTRFGALRDWSQIGQTIAPERVIRLQKVYRNSRQILEYIRAQGYEVEIPAGVRDGPAVIEHTARDVVDTLQYIVGLTRVPGTSLGIIAPSPEAIGTYRDYFASDESVKCLTMAEAQGVEFEVVCLVGVHELPETDTPTDEFSKEVSSEFASEQQHIRRDLLYVALTRAMNELHVINRNHSS